MSRLIAVGAILALALLLVLLLGQACVGEEADWEEVHGRVVDVQARSITEVDSFALVDGEGEEWSFVSEGPLEFTPSHLREHMLTGEEVSVRFRRVGGVLIAVGVADYP